MKYDFDKIVDRHGTDCYKWDMIAKRKLPADTLPLWVADMDFEYGSGSERTVRRSGRPWYIRLLHAG